MIVTKPVLLTQCQLRPTTVIRTRQTCETAKSNAGATGPEMTSDV